MAELIGGHDFSNQVESLFTDSLIIYTKASDDSAKTKDNTGANMSAPYSERSPDEPPTSKAAVACERLLGEGGT
jgi:hypothetical protein